MRKRVDNRGRSASTLVVAMVVLLMLAAPLAAVHLDTGYSSGAPLVHMSYNANGGDDGGGAFLPAASVFETGSMSSEVKFDPIPKRDGYVFTGWNTEADGTGKWYRVTDAYEERIFDGSGGAILYAQWQEIPIASKIMLDTNPTLNREVTWNAAESRYEWRLNALTWTPLENNIIQFSGGTLTEGSIIFLLTGGNPFPEDYPLYVIFNDVIINDIRTSAASTNNKVDIQPGATVILQLVGESKITHNSLVKAAVRAVSDATDTSELIITGQGMGKLTITRSNAAISMGALIGGDGTSSSGVSGEDGGHIQMESGILSLSNTTSGTSLRGASIGGGAVGDAAGGARGGDGGLFEMHGGRIESYQNCTGAAIYSSAIGGGGASDVSERAGHGGVITITGGMIDIQQVCMDTTYGVRGSGIGGASDRDKKSGDSGTINISGGNITVTQTGGAVSSSGIGAASGQYGTSESGQAIGTNESGGQNYISISGGTVTVIQSNTSTLYGTLRGAGIGGGAGSESGVAGGGADVRISGGNVLVDRRSTATLSNQQGAAIGGGAEESKESKVLISGGNVSVKISITGGTAANLAGAAIGNNLSPLSGSQIQIDGGVISISRMRGGTEMTVPIGPNGDFGKSPVINGGSIRASYDQDLTLGAPYVVFDSGGNSLMRYVVNLDIADDPQSLFVRRSGVLYPEYDNTERYADFHIQGKHKDLNTLGSYHQYYNLYLPEGSLTDPNHISLEYSSDGSVKTFSASGGSVTQTDTSKTFYRVVYRLGEKLRYEGDIVHIEDAVTFKQSIRAKNAYLNDVVAPWSLTYVERHDINYNDDAAVKDVTPLTGQYDYFASETPFILATGVATASTSYGNIEFNTAVSGRLVITAEDVKRVNVQYRDDYVYLEDPSVPVARQVDRVFGEGYPAIAVGLAKDGDTTTGPWALNGPPVATPLPEPADVIWTSDYFMFEYWRLNNAVSGMRYDTNDAYYIPAGSGDLTFHSVWEWKGRIYPAENGPGHIEYSLDGGTTWKTRTVTDAYGTFFPVPPQTVLLKAVPDAYAVFLQWGDAHGHVTGNDPAASVTVASTAYGDAKYATAWFHLETYRITTATSGDGSISPAGSVSAEAYEDKSFVITPMRDSSIIDVIVDGVSIGPVSSYTFWNIVSDHTIEVKFTLIPEYTITATGGEGVTVSPGGTVSVPIRNSHTVSWTAKLGYEVKDVAIDGLSHPELVKAGSYTFSNITSNHTIVVTAEKKHVFLTVNVEGKGGYVEYSLDGGWTFTTYTERLELIFGESPILRAVCEDGYMFVRWEGSRGGTNETIRIENISTDMTETSVFAEEGASDLSVLTIIGMTVGLSLMVVMAWVGGRVNIVMIDSDSAMIIGKKRARINQPYRFFVDFLEGEGFVTYRVGENKVWKEAIRDGGRYEIPPEDVTDTLTIKAR